MGRNFRHAEQNRAWHWKRRAAGLCHHCGEPRAVALGDTWGHPECNREYSAAYRSTPTLSAILLL